MTIKQHACFSAHCDACKRAFEQDGIKLHWDTEAEALSHARDYDWFKLPDGRLICDVCIETMLERGEVVASEAPEFAYQAAAPASLCLRCAGSGIDPEHSYEGCFIPGQEEPPALEPCTACQYPAPVAPARTGD